MKWKNLDVTRFSIPALASRAGANLTVELENDIHCSLGRATYEGRFEVRDVQYLALSRDAHAPWGAHGATAAFKGNSAVSSMLLHGALQLKRDHEVVQAVWPTTVAGLEAKMEFNLRLSHGEPTASEVSVALLREAPLPSDHSILYEAQAQLQLFFRRLRRSTLSAESEATCPS